MRQRRDQQPGLRSAARRADLQPGARRRRRLRLRQHGAEKPFVCPDTLKRCASTITYPFNGETSVELRGDFGGPDTWVTGKPMTKKGNVWSVDLTVPFGKAIQYKFFVDGTTWKIDAAQPKITDANANTNNTFVGKTCEPAICEEEGALPPGVFDWRDSVIYFVFVDRFFDGNPANNCDIPGVSGGTKSIANYQGGDWAGVTQKINDSYFTDLGVNTLWITVPFDNPQVAGLGVGGDNHQYSGYHGYWPKLDNSDPTVLQRSRASARSPSSRRSSPPRTRRASRSSSTTRWCTCTTRRRSSPQHSDWFWPNARTARRTASAAARLHVGDAIRERCWFTDYLPHWNYTNAGRARLLGHAGRRVDQADEGRVGLRRRRLPRRRHQARRHLVAHARCARRSRPTSSPRRRRSSASTWSARPTTSGTATSSRRYVDPATKLDGQFDFPLRANLVNAVIMRTQNMSDLASFMNSNDYYYGASAVMSTFIGNHDLPRIIHLAANNRALGRRPGLRRQEPRVERPARRRRRDRGLRARRERVRCALHEPRRAARLLRRRDRPARRRRPRQPPLHAVDGAQREPDAT